MAKSKSAFQTIRTEGALFPPDILQRIASLKVDGARSDDYHLPPGFKVKEAITASWNSLRAHWSNFQEARESLDQDETGTAVTNDRWLLPLFKELDYGRLTTEKSPVIEEKSYPIERFYNHTPIHLIGCNLPLDRRTKGARGAATASPHSMMQEFLNRSDDHLWAFLSNGRHLRILRDNISLSRQAFVEFDLEAMMDGEVYSDFALLWLLCHQSRVEADQPEQCWLEKWSGLAREQGTRILKDLRGGVEKSIEALGQGFISHPRNDHLRDRLQSGTLTKEEYYRQLLRIVYRLLFLFVAEDRELLHPTDVDPKAADLYDTYYSTRRLREMAERIRGSKHADLWHSLSLVFDSLGKDEGCPQLGLIGLGSFLWRSESTADLNGPLPNETGSPRPASGRGAGGEGPLSEPVYISNDDLLLSVRALAYVEQDRVLRSVDYRNLGSEELGSVYESLLELHPQMHVEAKTFSLNTAAGNERKTTGSYYTPDSLVQCLLDSALEPVVEARLKEAKQIARSKITFPSEGSDAVAAGEGKRDTPAWFDRVPFDRRDALTSGNYIQVAEQAILALTVCDPACGSGHFLIAAAHRLARHLARVRTGESEPSPADHQHALRDVIGRCIYGVDINPMAVELCKVSLWMEAIEPGKPLSFLDHHIQCGNSLLGTTPKLLANGIPNEAFKPIEGDDPDVCRDLRARNSKERTGARQGALQGELWDRHGAIKLGNMAEVFAKLSAGDDDSVEAIRQKELEYAKALRGDKYRFSCLLADLWCSAFVWRKEDTDLGRLCPTQYYLKQVESNPYSIPKAMEAEIRLLAKQYALFHWHLAYPDVFLLAEEAGTADNKEMGWSRGFDVVLGNPPWDKVQPEEQQFFAASRPEIAETTGAKRKKAIEKLARDDKLLYASWLNYKRKIEGFVNLTKGSQFHKLSGKGRLNTYSLFLESSWRVSNTRSGHVGLIVQTGLVTDDSNKQLFSGLVQSGCLRSIYDFENKEELFPGVHREQRFCLVTIGPSEIDTLIHFAFWMTAVPQLHDVGTQFTLTASDLRRMSPNTGACPTFKSKRESEILRKMYSGGVLVNDSNSDSSWPIKPVQFINLTSDSGDFVRLQADADTLGYLPLYEGKFTHIYDHRYGTFDGDGSDFSLRETSVEEVSNPTFSVRPQHWLTQEDFSKHLKTIEWNRRWFVTFHDIANPNNERTSIFSLVPYVPVGNSAPIVIGDFGPDLAAIVTSVGNSFPFDFATRRRIVSRHLNFFVLKQLPAPPIPIEPDVTQWTEQSFNQWVLSRVIELTYTAWDIKAFALDCGYDGPPFRWNEERRFLLRSELDATYFLLYLGTPDEWGTDNAELREMFPTPRDAVEYIMETFPIVKRKDIARTEVKNEAGEVVTPGTYITKHTILEIYDEMAAAIATGVPYQTRLNPPPGPPTDAAGNFIPMAQWAQNNWPSHIHRQRESDVVDTVPVTPVRTATPATRVPGIAASAAGTFPATDAQKLAVGLAADLAVRFSGSQEIAIRQYLGLSTNPKAIEKLLAGEGKDTELAKAVNELPDAFNQVNAEDAPWNKVFTTLQKNEAIEATDTDPVIVIAGPESISVIEHFGTLPDGYMQLVQLAIKSFQSTVAEEMDRDVANFLEEAQSPWLAESTG